MKRFKVRKALSELKGGKEKEDFLKKHNTKFTHNSYQNLIIWCSDGILELKAIK